MAKVFKKIEVGDAVYMKDSIGGCNWTPRRCQVLGVNVDLLEVEVYETDIHRGYIFSSSLGNFIHEDDFFKTQAVKVLLGDSDGWSSRLLLQLYYDVMSYAPVSSLFWGEFANMSEGELKAVVQVLEETSACLVQTS